MEWSRNRKWFTIALIGVILPTSLLAAFKITGIIPEPHFIPITIPPTTWTWERPFQNDMQIRYPIRETIEIPYLTNQTTLSVGVKVLSYEENYPIGWFPERDGIHIQAYVNATITQGFISSATINLKPMDKNATMYLSGEWTIQNNVSITEHKGTGMLDDDAYVKAKVFDNPCYLLIQGDWVFDDENTGNNILDHTLEITFTVIYFDGMSNKKISTSVTLQVFSPMEDNKIVF